ncbi:MAG TPA: hypothetical protein VJ583_09730, partial [Nitrososphaeraceae archaeon]|nr:hypothetical protein [Nitrososphaeraceae archaeon]
MKCIFIDIFPTINLINNNRLLLLLSNNKTTKNYTINIFLIFASSLIIPLFMFYIPTPYSQTESDEVLQEQQEQQQVCAEGQVFNEWTQTCESTPSTTTDLGTVTPVEEQQAPEVEQQAPEVEQQAPEVEQQEPEVEIGEEPV